MHLGMILIWNHFLFIIVIIKLQFATALDTTWWHWSAHHLIAVNDSLKEMASTNQFSILFSKLHNVFSMSAKNQKQLKDVASNLNDQVMRNGAIFTIKIDCFQSENHQCGIYTMILPPGFLKQELITAGLLKSVILSQALTVTSVLNTL